MMKKGLDKQAQTSLMRAIKEERLRQYLDNLAKLCDWSSLSEARPDLSKRLEKANSLRNKIMHGSTRTARHETVEACNTMLEVIAWLASNPFGYGIPSILPLHLATAEFVDVSARVTPSEVAPPEPEEAGEGGKPQQ